MSLFLLLLISLVSTIFSNCSMPSFLLNDFTRNVVKEREENIKCADSIQFEKKLLEAFFTFFFTSIFVVDILITIRGCRDSSVGRASD